MAYPARFASLLLVLLPASACDILSPPDGELVLMVSTGHFDVLADTVRVTHGQGLHFLWDRSPKPPYPSDIVPVLYADLDPEVFLCVRGEPSGPDKYLWQYQPMCDEASAWVRHRAAHRNIPPDSLTIMPLTDELREITKQIMPCDLTLNPENYLSQGAFRECATAVILRVGEVGPMLDYRPKESPWIRAVGCGGWTWATFVKLDGYKQPWPDPPFPGTARVEVEIAC